MSDYFGTYALTGSAFKILQFRPICFQYKFDIFFRGTFSETNSRKKPVFKRKFQFWRLLEKTVHFISAADIFLAKCFTSRFYRLPGNVSYKTWNDQNGPNRQEPIRTHQKATRNHSKSRKSRTEPVSIVTLKTFSWLSHADLNSSAFANGYALW